MSMKFYELDQDGDTEESAEDYTKLMPKDEGAERPRGL